MNRTELLDEVETLQNLLLAQVRGSNDSAAQNDADYKQLRAEVMQNEDIKFLLPRFVRTCRDLMQFWTYIKSSYPHYREREQFVLGEFSPLLDYLKTGVLTEQSVEASIPAILSLSDALPATIPAQVDEQKQNRAELRQKIIEYFDQKFPDSPIQAQ